MEKCKNCKYLTQVFISGKYVDRCQADIDGADCYFGEEDDEMDAETYNYIYGTGTDADGMRNPDGTKNPEED